MTLLERINELPNTEIIDVFTNGTSFEFVSGNTQYFVAESPSGQVAFECRGVMRMLYPNVHTAYNEIISYI